MSSYLGRFADVAKRLFATAGGEALYNLSPELLASVVLENDRPEWAALGNTRLWCAYSGLLAAGGAGHFNEVVIAPPSASIVCVITHIAVTAQVAIGPAVVTGMTGPVVDAVKFRDTRLSGRPATRLFTKDANPGLLGAVAKFLVCPVNTVVPIPPFVESNGSFLIENQTSNTALEVWAAGYERLTEDHETDATVS